jgi:hypothetical protein
MEAAVFIDTNLYKMISKDQHSAVDRFEYNLQHGLSILQLVDPNNRLYLMNTQFGFCEYLGMKLPKAAPSPGIWHDLDSVNSTFELSQKYVERFREDLCISLGSHITSEIVQRHIEEEEKFQSEAFKSSSLYGLFALYSGCSRKLLAKDLLELAVVDSLHQSWHYPAFIREQVEFGFRLSAYVEFFVEYRNFALLRSVKQIWLSRKITAREKELTLELQRSLDRGMRSIKPGQDRFDLELVTLFLFGHAPEGTNKRNPAIIYTMDSHEQFLARAVVVFSLFQEIARDILDMGLDEVEIPTPRADSMVFFFDDEVDVESALTGMEFIDHLHELSVMTKPI